MSSQPFADALRAAIQARGLGLERIKCRLGAEGVSVSLATLSYWQSGRSRPERRDSLIALAHLERLLEVPEGSLTALLGPPRPRGRWLDRANAFPDLSALWPQPAAEVGEVGPRWDERLTRLSQHDVVYVGPDREERSLLCRQLLRAEADGADRWVAVLHVDQHDRPLPLVRPVRRCRLGRVVSRPEDGLVVAELIFDRALTSGETIMIEHALVNRSPCPHATGHERRFRLPVAEFILEVRFDPVAVPRRCVQYARIDGLVEHTQTATPDAANSVRGVALNFGPGCYGFRWDW